MAYNKEIEARVLRAVKRWRGAESKKMFGGVCHLLGGQMFCGVLNDDLILRLGEKGAQEALRAEHVRVFDITGKPMKGWVMVATSGFLDDEILAEWLNEAREFVVTLPPKKQKQKKKK